MNYAKKRLEEKSMKFLLASTTLIIATVLLSIIVGVFLQGLPQLRWEVISQTPKGGYYFGKEGGFLNAILGSLWLAAGASFIALVISIPAAIFIHTYLETRPLWQRRVRFCLDVLWGTPPIVYGAFGLNIMLFMGWPASLLAAIITIAFLISPVMIRALDETLQQAPEGLFETALSMGYYKGEAGFGFLLKQAVPGLSTAFLLAFGKGIGDTAAVLLTAGYTDYIPQSLMEPAATLPLAIFFQLSSPIPEVKARAFAAAAFLTLLILVISISSRIISRKLAKHRLK